MEKDLYKVLGVDKSASEDDLKKAYHTLSKRYHPDVQQGKSDSEKKEAEERFKEINEAYSVLGDKEKRQKYDTFGTSDFNGGEFGPGGFDPMSFFRRHFGTDFGDFDFGFGFGGGHGHRRSDPDGPKRGQDVEIGLDISFEESIFGTTREFDIRFKERCQNCKGTGAEDGKTSDCEMCGGRGMVTHVHGNFMQSTTCPKCNGTGRGAPTTPCHVCHGEGSAPVKHHINIKIPAGIENRSRLRVEGEGEHGINGGQSGDLYITLAVGQSDLFRRYGTNLAVDILVPAAKVGLMDEIDVPTPYGTKRIKMPKRDSNGLFRAKIPGCGVTDISSNRGDLFVNIVPEPIFNPTDEQKKLCRKLLDSMTEDNVSEARKTYDESVERFEAERKKLSKLT